MLVWAAVAVALGLLLHRFSRGAWSLEDDDIPPVTRIQKLLGLGILVAALGGTVVVVWSVL
ncbi:hypothetical protein [Magnetospirillum sp. SS-4]|uniref:hypothetical protein n=1 Tax=Magnetospirillum sp. SS-4 TaxID=2681465 RepID=UPI0020C4E21E|nr:hypothetical protein [Magnetospirillum sp. SS-4]